MSNIRLIANRKYPSIPTVGGDATSHTMAIEAIRDAVQTHERRGRDPMNSFLRLYELIDIGLVSREGDELVLTFNPDDVGSGGASALADLIDVDLAGLSDGDVLVYDSVYGTWMPEAPSSASVALADLTDVDLAGLSDGDILVYDSVYGAWMPEAPSAGGSSPSASALSTLILASSPTGYWKCDDASTTIADSSGNGYNMTTVGTVRNQAAALIPADAATAKYLMWNGTGVNGATITSKLGTSPPLTGDWTFEALINARLGGSLALIFAMGAAGETAAANYQIYIYITSSAGININWESGSGTNQDFSSGIFITRGVTYHLAVVKDGTANTLTCYLNGIESAIVSYGTEPTDGTGTLKTTIGHDADSSSSGPIAIGHVAFYNGTKLTANQIAARAAAAGRV